MIFVSATSPAKSSKSKLQKIEEQDKELEEVLIASNIPHLHFKLRDKNVTKDVLWELDDEMLDDCKLNNVEKLQYKKAKEAH